MYSLNWRCFLKKQVYLTLINIRDFWIFEKCWCFHIFFNHKMSKTRFKHQLCFCFFVKFELFCFINQTCFLFIFFIFDVSHFFNWFQCFLWFFYWFLMSGFFQTNSNVLIQQTIWSNEFLKGIPVINHFQTFFSIFLNIWIAIVFICVLMCFIYTYSFYFKFYWNFFENLLAFLHSHCHDVEYLY